MAHPPARYLVAAPRRPDRSRWIVAVAAGAAVVLTASALLVATVVTGGPVTATPSLSPAPDTEVASAAESTPEAPTTGALTTQVNGRQLVLQLPEGQEPIGRVVLFPDTGQTAADAVATGDAVALLRAGWAVAASDGSADGAPVAPTAAGDLLTWSASEAPADPLVIATYGTGAASALAGLTAAGAQPTCWASSQPATAGVSFETVAALPLDTRYRVLAPPVTAPTAAREDAATLVDALEVTGHDVTTVELGAARADLLTALRGCEA